MRRTKPRQTLMAIALVLASAACGDLSGNEGERAAAVEAGSDGASTAAEQGTAPSTATEPSARHIPRFSKTRAMDHVRALARRIGPRVRTTRGETRAAHYVAEHLRSFGYNANVQEFSVDGGTSRNVAGWWPDARRFPVVIGAHMDTVPGSPGANDNASGVAVLLEIARVMAGSEQVRYVRFVAFGSEEYGTDGEHHVGSQVFVDRLGREGRRRLAGMISVDMVADGRPLLVGTSGIASEVVARTLYNKIRSAGIGVAYRTTCDCSDNGPFEHAGIPASYMWSGDEPDFHSPSDTVANMAPADLARSGRAVRAFVKALDQAMVDRFRRA